MAKDRKLRLVKPGEVAQPVELIAVQIVGINLIDGNTGLAMLSNQGRVYTYNGTGWVRLNMQEATE